MRVYWMEDANRVIVVPGYGHGRGAGAAFLKELMELLEARGVEVKFGVHPVAGRMPDMNVLLAEAGHPLRPCARDGRDQPGFCLHRRDPGGGCERRRQSGCQGRPVEPDLRMPILEAGRSNRSISSNAR